MKGDLLALEIKNTQGSVRVSPDMDGLNDPEKGDRIPLSWRVSALVLKSSVKGFVVKKALNLDMKPIGDGAAGDHVLAESFLDGILEKLAQKVDLKGCSRAVVAVPSSISFFRHMDFPFRSRWKIAQVLPLQLDTMLPLPDGPHVNDFIFTGISQRDTHTFLTASLFTGMMDVLCKPLKKRGITPVLISSAGYLAALFFLDSLPGKGFYLIMEVTSHCLVVNGVLDGVIVGVRSIAMGTDKNTAEVDLEVRRTLMLFRHRLGIIQPLLGCHLIGIDTWQDGRKPDDDLEARMEKILSTTVVCEELTPLSRLFDNNEIVVESTPYEYLNAFAAARSIGRSECLNFCRNNNGQGTFVAKYMAQLLTMGFLILICFCMGVAGEYIKIHSLRNQVVDMDQQAISILKEAFPDITTIVNPYMQMKIQVRQALEKSGNSSNLKNSFTADNKIMELFFELSRRISNRIDVEISRLIFNDGRMVLSGDTDTYDSVDKMKTAIESSPLFRDVKITNASAGKDDKRIRFKFIFRVTNGKEDVSADKKEKL